MKHLQLFEKWSSNFNRTLQGAYIKAKETDKGFGKVAKDIMDYAKRNITEEEFEVIFQLGEKTGNLKFIFNPKTLVEPISSIFPLPRLLWLPIIVKDFEGLNEMPTRLAVTYSDGKTELKIDVPDNPFAIIRFKDRKSVENFTSMLVQAVLSDPNEEERKDIDKIILGDAILSKLTPEEFGELPGDTKTKKVILYLIDEMIIKGDMRRLM